MRKTIIIACLFPLSIFALNAQLGSKQTRGNTLANPTNISRTTEEPVQTPIQKTIKESPESFYLGITQAAKSRLVGNEKDSTYSIDGVLGEKVKRTAISDDYIRVETSEVGTTEVKLLPLINKTHIICVAEKVCTSVCDTNLKFYTMDWQVINASALFPSFSKEQLFKESLDRNSQEYKNALTMIDMLPLNISLSADNTSMKLNLDIKGYLSEQDRDKLLPLLRDESIVLEWDMVSFK